MDAQKYFFEFRFPPNLNSLCLRNIKGKIIISLLKENLDYLAALEEFKLEKCFFDIEDLDNLLNLMDNFKSLLRLSLNEAGVNTNYLFELVPKIFKKINLLIELDISHNYYFKEEFFKSEQIKNISLSIPKSLISLKIFDPRMMPISKKTFDYLIETFGFVLDLEDNHPNIY